MTEHGVTDAQWEQLKGIVADALEREPAQRAAFLDSACVGDVDLRHEVQALLDIEDETDSYFEVTTQSGAPVRETDGVSRTIGRYTTRRVIASGGMGTVYEAVQDNPKRLVALKVLRHGAASKTALKRFHHEAEILGRLLHPNIAQIHDAGMFDEGGGAQPYFAMELVKGRPLVAYCESKGLATRDRLELFVKICNAVQYAHHKGVIHRDLKPDNILVDDFGEPKVLDFGVARTTDSDIQLTTVHTDISQIIGTVPYMSPEQVTGDPTDLDTRSDVYSLGVVVYELLCGQLPHDLRDKSVPDALRVIQESNPRPLSSISRVYRGDIDTIVSKALEKDKDRRYQTAAELAADIGHYLANEPIIARPASTFYQLRKFARRNRTLVGGFAAVLVVSLLGTIVALALAVQARSEAAKATAVSHYLMEMLADLSHADEVYGIGTPDPRGAVTEVSELADRAAERLETALAEWPAIRADMHFGLALAYWGLGDSMSQHRQFRKAYELRADTLGNDHPDTLLARLWLMEELVYNKGYLAAVPEIREVARRLRDVCGEGDPRTLMANNRQAEFLAKAGRLDESEKLFQQTLQLIREHLDENHRLLFMTEPGFAGHALTPLGKDDKAELLLRNALARSRRVLPGNDAAVARIVGLLLASLVAQSKHADADEVWIEFRSEPDLGEDSLGRALSHERWLGYFMGEPASSRLPEAEAVLRDALGRSEAALGKESKGTLATMHSLADRLREWERFGEAELLYREALEGRRRLLGPYDQKTLGTLRGVAASVWAQERYDEGEVLWQELITGQEHANGVEHRFTIFARNMLAWKLAWRGPTKLDKAEVLAREASETSKRVLGEEDELTLLTANTLAVVLHRQGRNVDAVELFEEIFATARRIYKDGRWLLSVGPQHYGRALIELARYEDAEAVLLHAHEGLEVTSPQWKKQAVLTTLIELYEAWDMPEKAAEYRD